MNKEYRSFESYILEHNLSRKIVIDDVEAFIEYDAYNIVYDKFWLSKSQNMICGPMGVYPSKYPIIFKPIINLYGMSRGYKKINSEKEYIDSIQDGLFWQPYFKGDIHCLDIILNKGKILFFHCIRSVKGINGTFQYHYTDVNYKISEKIIIWINTFLKDFQGLINLEIINDYIIEAHLRLNGDFHYFDLSFCRQVHDLFEKDFSEDIKINYSIPKLFLFPVFLDRDKINLLSDYKKKKITNILNKSNIVKTFYFDDIDSLHQGNILRIIYFDSYNFELGLKLKKFILNFIFIKR